MQKGSRSRPTSADSSSVARGKAIAAVTRPPQNGYNAAIQPRTLFQSIHSAQVTP